MIQQTEIEETRRVIEAAKKAGGLSAQAAQDRIRLAIEVGKRLNRWKEVSKRGEFAAILEQVGLPKRTAHRWRIVARRHDEGLIDLANTTTLRALYIQLELIPPKAPAESAPASKADRPVAALLSTAADALEGIDRHSMTDVARQTLLDSIAPLVRRIIDAAERLR